MRKLNQIEIVNNRCEELNYSLVEPFIYENNKSLIHLKCNRDDYEWYSVYRNFINLKRKCPKCSNHVKINKEEAESKVILKCKELDYELTEQFEFTTSIKSYIYLKCNKDNHEWIVRYDHFINDNKKCPKCSGRLIFNQDEINLKIIERCDDMNYTLLEPFIYVDKKSKIYLKCNKHNHEWFVSYNNFIYQLTGCPFCRSSKGENYVKKYLEENNISFIRQYIFDDCKYIKHLKYDFYLPDLNIIIEYQGEQHYKEKQHIKDDLKTIQLKDNIKREYCRKNNIKLIEISYLVKFKNINGELDKIIKAM